jgi:twitching motility protein PilT
LRSFTIEDPIEYVYESKQSLIHQREVGEDITDFASAIRSAQLAGTLKGIVSQCLIPCGGGTARVAATELLVGTDAILNLVREGKAHQIPAMMQTGSSSDMHTLNMDLSRLVRQGFITRDDAIAYTNNKAEVGQYL